MMNSKKTFANALNIGIEKARFIDHQSKEINQIIEELRSQIFLQTNGKVEVSVMDDASNYKSHSAVYDGPLFNIGTNKKILAAKNNEKTMRLSYWDTNKGGDPCTIKYGDISASAGDKESLIGILEDMLSDSDIAKNIIELMQGDSTNNSNP